MNPKCDPMLAARWFELICVAVEVERSILNPYGQTAVTRVYGHFVSECIRGDFISKNYFSAELFSLLFLSSVGGVVLS